MMGTLSSFGSGGFFTAAWPCASFAQYPRPGTGTESLRHVLPSATAETPYSSATFIRGFSQTWRYSSSRSYGFCTVILHGDILVGCLTSDWVGSGSPVHCGEHSV